MGGHGAEAHGHGHGHGHGEGELLKGYNCYMDPRKPYGGFEMPSPKLWQKRVAQFFGASMVFWILYRLKHDGHHWFHGVRSM